MRRHLFWIFELFVWLLVLSLISASFIFVRYMHRKNFDSYQIFLPDVDGIINGSPVRFMGIEVGYVNQISVIGDEVYVRFIINKNDCKLPNGSIATVSFTGLAGSKSLEIYPPTEETKNSNKVIIAQTPKRLNDSISLFDDMFAKIDGIGYEVSKFVKSLDVIQKKDDLKDAFSEKSVNDFLDVSDKWLDEMNEKFKHKE